MIKKAFYRLAEASELLQQPMEFFCQLGADSSIPLYVKVPVAVKVVNVGPSDLVEKRAPDERIGRPLPVHAAGIDIVQLWPKDCQMLLNAGISVARYFPKGGALDDDGKLRCGEPPIPAHDTGFLATYKGFDRLRRYFAVYGQSVALDDWAAMMRPASIEVEAKDVLIAREAMLGLHVPAHGTSIEVLRQAALEKPHTTALMRSLCKVHSELCEGAYLHGQRFPLQKAIELRLRDESGFTGNLAQCGAWILVKTTIKVDPLTGRKILCAPQLEALLKCADDYWSTSLERPSPNPRSEEIATVLGRFGFSKSHGKAAATLIRPASAQKGRKRGIPNDSAANG